MDVLSDLENAISADLLRADMLGRPRPELGGRYVVLRFLGRGASGLVVEARDERLGRVVALKLGDARTETSMLGEARALAALDHPNVVRIHDVDVTATLLDDRPFRLWLVSMQRVDGSTLRAWVRDASPSRNALLRAFLDAGHGLAAAHEARILHRDFKPDNVIVRSDGVAQVLDFGFAIPSMSASSAQVQQSTIAGTDPYMAPEARTGHASRRSDQFSFGVSIVETLTGEPLPARGRAPVGVAPAIWRVLQRATSDRAEARYPSMAELLGALEIAGAERSTPKLRRAFRVGVFATAVLAGYVWLERPPLARDAYRAIRRQVDALELDQRPGAERRPRAILAPVTTRQAPIAGSAAQPSLESPFSGDAGRPDGTDRESRDAVPADRSGGPPIVVASVGRDAGVSPTCPRVEGTYRLEAHGQRSITGYYELVLTARDTLVRVTRFRKTGSRGTSQRMPLDQALTVREVTRSPDCGFRIRATLSSRRDYTFRLQLDSHHVGGSFTSSGEREADRDRGEVTGRLLRAE